MSDALSERLKASLGGAYTLERELGGGGMSRVFVAEELALGRKVVVKVLPPELAAGVSVERFKREIQMAARLQHPHIVPVLTAGDSDGLPYYTMPFVEGSSLRARLARGVLTITEIVGILREVARALAYAHEHGVVHRDIKPDNVLLQGGSAVVTDFGIAKAISAARTGGPGGATLTQHGTSLGTPAYMAPEQAAGDPSMDHRADIYAYGVMAYELLSGRTPFHGLTPHRMLAAQMSDRPVSISELRPDTPPLLAELVMRCLEKDPAQRPQGAGDLARVLETVTSGTGQAVMPNVLLGGRVRLWKALGIYAGAFVAVAILAKAAIVGIGLPDWVFPGALVVMALGLPVVLFTYFVHRQTYRALTVTPTLTPGGSAPMQGTMATIAMKASPFVTWRRTAMGGAWAVGAFVVLIGVWMVMRALGIGPAASLMSSGKLGARERVILAEFKGPATDSLLGLTVTEAFRTDLAQSANLNVMPASAVREVVRRMQRPANTHVDFPIAREIATREGIKAVVDGEVVSLGGNYVLSARLVAAQTGEELAALRETASDAKDLVPAIGRLSKALRSRIGESLRVIQNARTLDKVSTPSLQALQKYVQGIRVMEVEGDFSKGRALLEEAVALDTGFAMAYRKLAVELNNRGLSPAEAQALVQKAYDHRDRLSDAERYLTVAYYFTRGSKPDWSKSVSAYESLLDIDPDNVTALNNLAVQYHWAREFAKAEVLATRAIRVQGVSSVYYTNVVGSQVLQGKMKEAEATMALMQKNLPQHPATAVNRATMMMLEGQYDGARSLLDSLRSARSSDKGTRLETESTLASVAMLRGQLVEAARWGRASGQSAAELGARSAPLQSALGDVFIEVWFRGDREQAKRMLERALAEHPLDALAPADRPHFELARLYALTGQPDRLKATLAAFDKKRVEFPQETDELVRHVFVGWIAQSGKKHDEAIREFRAADIGACVTCALPMLANAYDLAGNADSAIAVYDRYVGTKDGLGATIVDPSQLAGAHKRLGELYEAKGDRTRAITHYQTFVDLWKNADPELQPLVRQARERLTKLQQVEKR